MVLHPQFEKIFLAEKRRLLTKKNIRQWTPALLDAADKGIHMRSALVMLVALRVVTIWRRDNAGKRRERYRELVALAKKRLPTAEKQAILREKASINDYALSKLEARIWEGGVECNYRSWLSQTEIREIGSLYTEIMGLNWQFDGEAANLRYNALRNRWSRHVSPKRGEIGEPGAWRKSEKIRQNRRQVFQALYELVFKPTDGSKIPALPEENSNPQRLGRRTSPSKNIEISSSMCMSWRKVREG